MPPRGMRENMTLYVMSRSVVCDEATSSRRGEEIASASGLLMNFREERRLRLTEVPVLTHDAWRHGISRNDNLAAFVEKVQG